MSSNLPSQPRPADIEAAAPSAVPAVAPDYLPFAPPAVEEEGKVDVRRVLAAILRHKWLVLIMIVAGSGGGYVFAKAQKPVYEAQSTIWVELASGGAQGPIQQGQLVQNTNWTDLLTSFAVMDSVVKEVRLFVWAGQPQDTEIVKSLDLKERSASGQYELLIDPSGRRFALSLAGGQPVQTGQVGDSIGPDLGLLWLPPASELRPGRLVKFGLVTPRQAALDVVGRLVTKMPLRDGNFIRVTLSGTSPGRTAATLNAITEQFVHVAAELKKDKLRQFSGILQDQLETAHNDLVSAEGALESFRVRTITEPNDAQAPVVASGLSATQSAAMTQFFAMKTTADQLRRDRLDIERVLATNDSGVSLVVLETNGSVAANADLKQAFSDLLSKQQLVRTNLTRYTTSNPLVSRPMQEVQILQRQTIPDLLRELLIELRTRERLLGERVAATERDLRQIPTRTIEEARLRRDEAIAEQLYQTLQQRYSAARLAEASSIPDVRILDAAVAPDNPVKNLKMMVMMGGIAAGVGLGIGLALLLDKLDRRLRYPDEVSKLGLTILGAVPRVKSRGAGLRGDDASQVVESLRSIRLNLVNAYGSAGPLITTITSPGSGDGKSFLASNLALAFADAGHRTLLIDGDIRRGTLHRVLNVSRKPGLLDFLGGQATREQIVQATRVPSVDFIGCGTRKMGGPELLASPAMSQLIIGLRSQYSVIIIDSAPLGAGVDPLVLGSLTGSLLLVIRTGVTDRELASAKLGDLDRLPIRVLGAVLNDVKAEGVYKYYSYLPGYSSDDEVEGDDLADRVLPAGKA